MAKADDIKKQLGMKVIEPEPEKDKYPHSPCCDMRMLRTMYDVRFCSGCGAIIERSVSGKFIKSLYNIKRYTVEEGTDGWTPEELYLRHKDPSFDKDAPHPCYANQGKWSGDEPVKKHIPEHIKKQRSEHPVTLEKVDPMEVVLEKANLDDVEIPF